VQGAPGPDALPSKPYGALAGYREMRKIEPGSTSSPTRGGAVAYAVEAQAAKLDFLPVHSPDFNLIEPAFGQVMLHLRKAAKRAVNGRWKATTRHLKTSNRATARITSQLTDMIYRGRIPV